MNGHFLSCSRRVYASSDRIALGTRTARCSTITFQFKTFALNRRVSELAQKNISHRPLRKRRLHESELVC
jgi:hypothetical protein